MLEKTAQERTFVSELNPSIRIIETESRRSALFRAPSYTYDIYMPGSERMSDITREELKRLRSLITEVLDYSEVLKNG